MMEKEMKKVPAVRFKGFTDDWEQRKLGEILTTIPFKSYLKKPEFDGKYEIIQQGNNPIIGYANGNPCTDYENIVIFGDHTLSLYKPESPFFVATDGVRILKGVNEMNGYYLEVLLERNRPKNEGYKRYYSILADEECYISVSREEQCKIGVFFHYIDNAITLHQRKSDQLKKVKAYFLQNLFPAKGEKVPKIRFKGFTGPWEQRKLGDFADVTKLAGFEFTKYVTYSDTGNIIALRGLNVKKGKLVLDDVKYIDNSDFSKLSRSKLYSNDILFTYVGTIGELAIIHDDNRFYLAPNVARIRIIDKTDSEFIVQLMESDEFYRYMILPLIASSSQPALSMENIRKFELNLPLNLDEQKQVGIFFAYLDKNITLHQRKLEELQTLKKFLLQNLFV